MKIAIPLAAGRLSMHFGHCETFALVDVDEKTKEVSQMITLQPPAHQAAFCPE